MNRIEIALATMSFDEHFRFQELKSAAFVEQRLTLAEAQLLFDRLGGTAEHFNAQPLHVKAVLTQVFAELLASRIPQKHDIATHEAAKTMLRRKKEFNFV